MLPAIWAIARVYAPYIVFPVAVIVGAVGYNLENILSDRKNALKNVRNSVGSERSERRLTDLAESDATQVESLKKHSFVPKTIFEKNVSPSLQTDN